MKKIGKMLKKALLGTSKPVKKEIQPQFELFDLIPNVYHSTELTHQASAKASKSNLNKNDIVSISETDPLACEYAHAHDHEHSDEGINWATLMNEGNESKLEEESQRE